MCVNAVAKFCVGGAYRKGEREKQAKIPYGRKSPAVQKAQKTRRSKRHKPSRVAA